MKKVILATILAAASFSTMAASIVGVGSANAVGVIGGTNSASLSVGAAAIRTGSVAFATPFGAAGQSATISIATGANLSSPNANGGFATGAIGGSGAGGFNSGNASVPFPLPVPVPVVLP